MQLGKMIRQIREENEHDQIHFADYLQCSQSYVSKIEKGWTTPNTYFLRNLRDYYNVDLNKLFDECELP